MVKAVYDIYGFFKAAASARGGGIDFAVLNRLLGILRSCNYGGTTLDLLFRSQFPQIVLDGSSVPSVWKLQAFDPFLCSFLLQKPVVLGEKGAYRMSIAALSNIFIFASVVVAYPNLLTLENHDDMVRLWKAQKPTLLSGLGIIIHAVYPGPSQRAIPVPERDKTKAKYYNIIEHGYFMVLQAIRMELPNMMVLQSDWLRYHHDRAITMKPNTKTSKLFKKMMKHRADDEAAGRVGDAQESSQSQLTPEEIHIIEILQKPKMNVSDVFRDDQAQGQGQGQGNAATE